jgi:DNA-directed RNA polymerase sigma subunit (sigma70/sigma32)
MAPAEPRPSQVPPHLIERIHALVRTSQRMLTEIGREPTPQELAERLRMPGGEGPSAARDRKVADQSSDGG